MAKQMDPDRYRRDLLNMGASKKDADAAAKQLREQQRKR